MAGFKQELPNNLIHIFEELENDIPKILGRYDSKRCKKSL